MIAITHKLGGRLETNFTPGLESVRSAYLVNPQNIPLPPIHVKLGLMKNYTKALDKDDPTFKLLEIKFSRTSEKSYEQESLMGHRSVS